tara:strand:- start:255 stop:698 length:444 start_codon:yes stop_codon:yes gene_type:complete
MAITYDKISWANVLDKARDLLIAEYNYIKVYIAPKVEHHDNVSIRLWMSEAESISNNSTGWARRHTVEIALYSIYKKPGEREFKQLYDDGERVYQLFKNNITVSGSLGWYDGEISDMTVNDFEDEEEEIEGLNVIKYNFNCTISRPT